MLSRGTSPIGTVDMARLAQAHRHRSVRHAQYLAHIVQDEWYSPCAHLSDLQSSIQHFAYKQYRGVLRLDIQIDWWFTEHASGDRLRADGDRN